MQTSMAHFLLLSGILHSTAVVLKGVSLQRNWVKPGETERNWPPLVISNLEYVGS